MRKKCRLAMIGIIGVVLGATLSVVPAHGHPHVFIDSRVTFQFDKQEMEGFWVEWHFDPLFTSMIVMDYGAPREGPFTQDVIRTIREGAFKNLRHYDYFTYVIVDDRKYPAEEARDFTAFMRDRRIVYQFFVPFRHPLDGRVRTIRVRMSDKTFFTDIAFSSEQPVSVESPISLEKQRHVERNENLMITYDNRNQSIQREGATYTGLTHPWEAILRYRRRID